MGTVSHALQILDARRKLFLNEVSENFCETMRQTFIRKKEGARILQGPCLCTLLGRAPVEETSSGERDGKVGLLKDSRSRFRCDSIHYFLYKYANP